MLTRNKGVEERSREIENTRCILWLTGKEKHRNGVGIVVENN